jgi:hypothetical protein
MSDVADPNYLSSIPVNQAMEIPENSLSTPSSEGCFSEFVAESPYSYQDFNYLNENTLGIGETEHIGTYQHPLFRTCGYEGDSIRPRFFP